MWPGGRLWMKAEWWRGIRVGACVVQKADYVWYLYLHRRLGDVILIGSLIRSQAGAAARAVGSA